jgi:hypothetical protein
MFSGRTVLCLTWLLGAVAYSQPQSPPERAAAPSDPPSTSSSSSGTAAPVASSPSSSSASEFASSLPKSIVFLPQQPTAPSPDNWFAALRNAPFDFLGVVADGLEVEWLSQVVASAGLIQGELRILDSAGDPVATRDAIKDQLSSVAASSIGVLTKGPGPGADAAQLGADLASSIDGSIVDGLMAGPGFAIGIAQLGVALAPSLPANYSFPAPEIDFLPDTAWYSAVHESFLNQPGNQPSPLAVPTPFRIGDPQSVVVDPPSAPLQPVIDMSAAPAGSTNTVVVDPGQALFGSLPTTNALNINGSLFAVPYGGGSNQQAPSETAPADNWLQPLTTLFNQESARPQPAPTAPGQTSPQATKPAAATNAKPAPQPATSPTCATPDYQAGAQTIGTFLAGLYADVSALEKCASRHNSSATQATPPAASANTNSMSNGQKPAASSASMQTTPAVPLGSGITSPGQAADQNAAAAAGSPVSAQGPLPGTPAIRSAAPHSETVLHPATGQDDGALQRLFDQARRADEGLRSQQEQLTAQSGELDRAIESAKQQTVALGKAALSTQSDAGSASAHRPPTAPPSDTQPTQQTRTKPTANQPATTVKPKKP